MTTDRLQRQRFELKYRLPSCLAPAVREFVRCHLELDPFGASQPDCAYPVKSLYLDSPDLRLRQATINGDRNRFKLRLRYYSDAADAPVFFEIKSRVNDGIRKRRAGVRRAAVGELLAGVWPDFGHLAVPDARALTALQAFCHIAADLPAGPCAHVEYRREAWVLPRSNALRVTFDRAVQCAAQTHPSLQPPPRPAVPVFGSEVILEVKFTDRFPRWIGEMVQCFDLVRASAAKYVDGLGCVLVGRSTAALKPGATRPARHEADHDRKLPAR